MPADVLPYACLAEDPTTAAVICWVDATDGADGTAQTLNWDGGSVDVTGELMQDSGGVYRYWTELTGLTPDTTYTGTINGTVDISWDTLNPDLSQGLNITTLSDVHPDYIMSDPSHMAPIGATDPDILLLVGDVITNIEYSAEQAAEWVEWWELYVNEHLHGDGAVAELVPFFWTPGNHDVGNMQWDGNEADMVSPDNGYFQYFNYNPMNLDPVGENYGSIHVGPDLQLLNCATHSAYAPTVGTWIANTHDPDAKWCIPFHHAPLFAGGSRYVEDDQMQAQLREEWGAHFLNADNIHFSINGHVHVTKRTVEFALQSPEPSHTDYFQIPEGYIVDDPADYGLVEYGDGWPGNRDAYGTGEWYLELSEETRAFFTIQITDGTMTFREHSADGSTYNTTAYPKAENEPEKIERAVIRNGTIRSGHL